MFLVADVLHEKDFAAIAYAAYSANEAQDDNEAAKEEAILAVNQYAQGNKAPLAKILAAGIKYLNGKAEQCEQIDSEHFVVNGEYVYRMSKMLERDQELKKLANLGGSAPVNDARNRQAIKVLVGDEPAPGRRK